jgi:hypothetical protein
MNRRQFLRRTITGTLAATLSPHLMMCSTANNRQLDEIGIITNTIQKPLEKDYEKTLEQIAEIGYNMLEFGGHYGPSKQSFMELLKRLNIKPIAGGTSMDPLLKEPEKHIEEQPSRKQPGSNTTLWSMMILQTIWNAPGPVTITWLEYGFNIPDCQNKLLPCGF